MGLVLWIDRNTFATGLLEKAFKKKSLSFYSLENAKDFAYLVDDLKPQVLVFDEQTLLTDLESFQAQYSQNALMKSLPVILVDSQGKLEFIQNKIGDLKRPFDPFQIPAIIENLLKKN